MSSRSAEESTPNDSMFSEEEKNHLQSFLNELEMTDVNSHPQHERDHVAEHGSSKRKNEKKRTTPYPRKERSFSQQSDEPISAPTASTSTARGGRARKPAHELLSENQKKANHIASEQKRRANIKIGFDQLVDSVPGLDDCHRSEALILQKSVEYIRNLVRDKNELKEKARELQVVLGDIPDEDSSEGEIEYSYK